VRAQQVRLQFQARFDKVASRHGDRKRRGNPKRHAEGWPAAFGCERGRGEGEADGLDLTELEGIKESKI